MKKELLRALENDAALTNAQLAMILEETEDAVAEERAANEKAGVILGYKTVIDWDKTDREYVTALIEVKIQPQRGCGFDRIAEKICAYPEVKSLYLMSGGFDLTVIIEGRTMKEVASFVTTKLSVIESVTSTATHFVLHKYKDEGILFGDYQQDERESCAR